MCPFSLGMQSPQSCHISNGIPPVPECAKYLPISAFTAGINQDIIQGIKNQLKDWWLEGPLPSSFSSSSLFISISISATLHFLPLRAMMVAQLNKKQKNKSWLDPNKVKQLSRTCTVPPYYSLLCQAPAAKSRQLYWLLDMDPSKANSWRHNATHSSKTVHRHRQCAIESLLSGVGIEEAEPDTGFEVQMGHNDPYNFKDEYLDEEYGASLHYTTPH